MEFVNKFITDFMHLPGKYNEITEHKSSFNYYKAFYSASVRAPFGERYLSESPIKGFHFQLTISLEPISEEAEVLNSTVSFIITDSSIEEIKFNKNYSETSEADMQLSEDSCLKFYKRIDEFCNSALKE